MNRRDFVAATVAGGVAAAGAPAAGRAAPRPRATPFTLAYAPHFGMFAHHAGQDPLDQLRFMADEGFRALEDNGLMGRPPELQQKIGDLLSKLGMTMGVFVTGGSIAWQPSLATGRPEFVDEFLADCSRAVDTARRVNARWTTVVPGQLVPRLEPGYQTAHVIDALRRACDILEPHAITMVLEPLNPWRDHPGQFLARIHHAFEICRAVNRPSCKILFDIYHQQITEGNLIPNLDLAWHEIAYIQVGDNPGRCEPTTGEINYARIFRHLRDKGYSGVVGMEHGNSREGRDGERAVIDAYRTCDPA